MSLDKPIEKFIEDQKNKNALSKTRGDVSLLSFSTPKMKAEESRKSRQKSLMNISVNFLKKIEIFAMLCTSYDF